MPQPSQLAALWCWYDGGRFRGYQSQPVGPTVQDTLIDAFRAAGFERKPLAAGRTDLGVHARMQVVSFRVVERAPAEEIAARINAHLPQGVGIAVSREPPRKFHPQFAATGKEYRYRLARAPNPQWDSYAWRTDCDVSVLKEALSVCVGTHDFQAFHDKSSAVRPRTISAIEVLERPSGLIDVRIRGEGFAKYMVRYVVGSAVLVARDELPLDVYRSGVLQAVAFKGLKAPAQGLTLWEVRYAPTLEPFSSADRESAVGLPRVPPFVDPA